MGFIALAYGVFAYLLFFAGFLYLIVFVGADMTALAGVPKTIDAGEPAFLIAPPALQNVLLILLFGLSHSVMARPGFKKAWTKIVPVAAERPTYVLVATLALILLYAGWVPMPEPVWTTTGFAAAALTTLFFIGWGVLLLATFLINHFELFGLRQVWRRFRGGEYPPDPFRTPLLYRATRHPLYLGFIIAFWSAATMTVGHLLFAALMTIYVFIAIGYEERDLITHFGDDYRRYMARVPTLFPIGWRKE